MGLPIARRTLDPTRRLSQQVWWLVSSDSVPWWELGSFSGASGSASRSRVNTAAMLILTTLPSPSLQAPCRIRDSTVTSWRRGDKVMAALMMIRTFRVGFYRLRSPPIILSDSRTNLLSFRSLIPTGHRDRKANQFPTYLQGYLHHLSINSPTIRICRLPHLNIPIRLSPLFLSFLLPLHESYSLPYPVI